jgi:RsiW-degrading membrane proteinase PrsW (M82 family)
MYGLETAFIRALTAVPGHACFGVFMGAWYGLAKSHELHGNTEYCKTSRRLALVCPVLLHGLYDLIATLDRSELSLVFVGFIAVMFLAAYRTVKKLSAQDKYL